MSNKTVEKTVNIQLGGILSLAMYFGIGFLCHWIFIGSTIVWTDAFALFILALWPFYLLFLFFKWVIIIGIIALVVILIYEKFFK